MKKLKSPNVVRVFDVVETFHDYYIIQEYCNGGDFRNLIKNKKIFSESDALIVLKGILSGFIELLQHRIIHRDLKPESIFIHYDDGNAVYKLTDFSQARTVINIYILN